MSDSNQENNHDGNGLNFGNDILEALLLAAQGAEGTENLGSLEAIGGEYSSINNTLDELNKYMDRWEERHDRLRDEIREVITEQEQENEGSDGEQVDDADKQTGARNGDVDGASQSTSQSKENDPSDSSSHACNDTSKSEQDDQPDKESS